MTDSLQADLDRYIASNQQSLSLHERAAKVMPGGDSRNSIWWPPFPVYVARGDGSRLYDVDGNERVDMVNNMTTLILGHRHPSVVKAMRDQLDNGVSFPAPSPPVIEWAEIMVDRVPVGRQGPVRQLRHRSDVSTPSGRPGRSPATT